MTVAVILSSVSLLFIALSHLDVASSFEWVISWITLSHQRTHIRWAASEINICRSRVAPLCFTEGPVFWLFLLSWLASAVLRHKHPSIVPRLISGHRMSVCGHMFFAWFQTVEAWPTSHYRSVCFMFSIVAHGLHIPLWWKSWMLNHTSPIIGVLWIALNRNIWTLRHMVRFLIPCHIDLFVSSEPV